MSQSRVKTIKVGTFNLMNLMLPDRPVYGGTLSYSQEEYARKAEWVRFMLEQMDADIICFQELFHRAALTRIIKDMPKYRNARVYIADETGDQPCVAILSRYPVEDVRVYTDYPEHAIIDFNPKGRERVELPFSTFTRPVLKADVKIEGYGIITVFCVHLKSKREIFYVGEHEQDPVDLAKAQSRSLMLRASESVALRALVADVLRIPDRPVVLCGDVNDVGNSVTSRIISGDVPQHRLADNVKKQVWDVLLYHVKDIQARRSYQDFYYTHIHNGVYESLDHIMVSQELVTEYPRNTGRVGLVSVYNDHLIDQTFSKKPQDKCKSDHGVVVCSLELDLDRAKKYMVNASEPEEDDDYDDEYFIQEEGKNNRNNISHHDIENNINTENNVDEEDDSEEAELLEAQRIFEDLDNQVTGKEEYEPEGFDLNRTLDRWRERNPKAGKGSRRPGRRDGNQRNNNTKGQERLKFNDSDDRNHEKRSNKDTGFGKQDIDARSEDRSNRKRLNKDTGFSKQDFVKSDRSSENIKQDRKENSISVPVVEPEKIEKVRVFNTRHPRKKSRGAIDDAIDLALLNDLGEDIE